MTLHIRNFGKINDLVICNFVIQNKPSSVRKGPNTCTRLLSHQVVNQDSDLEVQALNQPIVLQDLEFSQDGIQCSICPSSSLNLPYSPNMYFIPLQPTWSQTHLQCLTFTSAPPTGYFLLYIHNFQILSSVSKKFSLIFWSCDNLSSELLHLHSPSTAIGFLRLRDKKLQLFISSTQYQTSSTWAFSLYLSNELKMPLLSKNKQCL